MSRWKFLVITLLGGSRLLAAQAGAVPSDESSAAGEDRIQEHAALLSAQSEDRTAPRPALPRHIAYGLLFREIVRFNARADELATQLKPDAFLRNYHRSLFDLSASLDSQLKDVARDCVRAMDALDRRASDIIWSVKRQYRNAPRGVIVPPPPSELFALEAERKAVILGTVERLQQAFGPAQFALFDADVRRYVGSSYRASAPPRTPAQ